MAVAILVITGIRGAGTGESRIKRSIELRRQKASRPIEQKASVAVANFTRPPYLVGDRKAAAHFALTRSTSRSRLFADRLSLSLLPRQ